MIRAARGYLYLMCILFVGLGLTALFAPHMIFAQFDLLANSAKGVAEIRSLYGGAFLSWGLLTIVALRGGPLSQGLLIAMVVIMGGIAAARLVSLMVDQAFAFNIPAEVVEILALLAYWTVYKHNMTRE
jgi:hypothetical protein